MELSSVQNLREDDVKIEGKPWDNDVVQLLVAKMLLKLNSMVNFWKPAHSRAGEYMDAYNGEILTSDQVATYEEVEDKYVVQRPIMKSPVRALLGQMLKSRKSGQIITEGGSYDHPAASAEECAVINAVLKHAEKKTCEKYKVRDAIHDSMVTCFPNALYYSLVSPEDGLPSSKLRLDHLPWNSVLVGPPNIRDVDQIKEMAFYMPKSKADLLENFPEMEEQIQAHFDDKNLTDSNLLSSLKQWEGAYTSEDMAGLFDIVESAVSTIGIGLAPIVQFIFPIKRKEDIWINVMDPSGEDYVVRPPKWSNERWEKWTTENGQKYQGPYEKDVVILWSTVISTTGICLANEKHWFQNRGMLPAEFFIPAIIGGKPTGPVADMYDDMLAVVVGDIENLDDLRKGEGNLVAYREGTVSNVDSLPEESNKAMGFAIVNADHQGPIQDAFYVIPRRSSERWKNYSADTKQGMYENTRLNESMQGGAAPRQAAVAKELEITQALIVNAIYVDNFNRSFERLQNKKLAIMPYAYDEFEVLEIQDEESNNMKSVNVNEPSEFDEEGNVVAVINDLTAKEYKWVMSEVDDSPTAKTQMMQESIGIINASAGPLIQVDGSGKFFSKFLMAMPNQFLKDAGKALAKDSAASAEQQSKADQQETLIKAQTELSKAQANLLKAEKTGVSLSLTGEDLMQYPNLYQVYMQMQAAAKAGSAQGAQQATQPPQPQQEQMDPMMQQMAMQGMGQ